MVIKQFAPSAALAPFIRAYEIIETQNAVTRTLLPDTCIIIGFRYAGSSTLLNGDAARPPLPNRLGTIIEASTDDERVAKVEQFLLTRYRPIEPHAVVSAALRAIGEAAGKRLLIV